MKNPPDSGPCYICNSAQVKPHKHTNGFNVVKCHDCNLMWVIDKVDPVELERFYEETYYESETVIGYRDYLADEALHRSNARCLIEEYENLSSLEGRRILDVGCAAGFFLDEARRLRNCDVYGIESSEHIVKPAQELLGDRILHGVMDADTYPENHYDTVFLIGTIEHLIDPRDMLEKIHRVIKPGGYIGITTLDTRCWMPLYSIKPPEHLYYFDHDNLSLMVKQCGFETVLRKTHFASFFLHDLFHRLGNFFNMSLLDKFSDFLETRFPQSSVRIPTNEMLIVAKKN